MALFFLILILVGVALYADRDVWFPSTKNNSTEGR